MWLYSLFWFFADKKRTSFPIQKHQYSVLYFQISYIFMTPSNVHFEEYWMISIVYVIEAQLLPCSVFFFMGFSLHWNLVKTLSILCIFINWKEQNKAEALLLQTLSQSESFITIVLHVRCLRKISAVHLFFIFSWNKNKNSPWQAAVNTALLDIDQTVPDSCKTEEKKKINILKGAQRKRQNYQLQTSDPQEWNSVGGKLWPQRGDGRWAERQSQISCLSSSFYVLLANTADLTPHSGHLVRLWARVKTCFDCPCHKRL